MIRPRVLLQVTRMTFREFMRTPGAVFWTYGFPLLMAIALGFAFQNPKSSVIPVAVVEADFAGPVLDLLRENDRLQPSMLPRQAADEGFRRGKFLLVLSSKGGAPEIKLDPTRPESELARLLVERTLRAPPASETLPEIVNETAPGWRYIDWLIPGLIGLNLLGAGMWGVGFNLVQMRVKNILRRLMVTPMHRSEFLIAFLFSRLLLVIPEAGAIIAFGAIFFDVPMHGSWLSVLCLVVLGATAFTGLGMLVASRAQTIETVSGLMNLIMLPMWLLGGCFFSSDRFPDLVQPLVRALPITHLNNALRAVMGDGASLGEILPEVGFLVAFAVVGMGLSIRCFRWT